MDAVNDEIDLALAGVPNIEPQPRVISGFWSRLLALILDGLCLGLIGLVLGLCLFDPLTRLGAWGRLLGFCIALLYFGILNSTMGKGQTVGKRIMKIVVVDRAGHYLSLGQSFLRFTVLGTPYFLNGAMLTPDFMATPLGYLIVIILIGVGGAIVYLYLFNRQTRQSLHDLVVGSFVTKKLPAGPVAVTLWRPHLLVVALWFLAAAGLSVVVSSLGKKAMFQELLAVQRVIQASGKVHTATAFTGKSWNMINGHSSETTSFQSTAIWKEKPRDEELAAQLVASIILKNYAGIMDKDVLAVTITHGFDIGIASSWISTKHEHSPKEWREILATSASK